MVEQWTYGIQPRAMDFSWTARKSQDLHPSAQESCDTMRQDASYADVGQDVLEGKALDSRYRRIGAKI